MTIRADLFTRCVEEALRYATGPVSVVGYGQGTEIDSYPSEKCDQFVLAKSQKNFGVSRGLTELYKLALGAWPDDPANEILCYLHDDLFIQELGWDDRVRNAFDSSARLGLAGFGGAPAMSGDRSLGRLGFMSNMENAEAFGFRVASNTPVVFVDGYAVILRRSFLDQIGGWSWWPERFVHHGYDRAIACMTRRHGFSAMLIPVSCVHGDGGGGGGLSRHLPSYSEIVEPLGGDGVVHDAARDWVYNEFQDVLPLRL